MIQAHTPASVISPALPEAAMAYARQGKPVFPCHWQTKRPLVSGGFQVATTDEATILGWWHQWPQAMIGMPTGAASGVWVLDVDDPEQFKAGAEIELPDTRRCETGKGYHLYFTYPSEGEVRNRQKHPKRGMPFAELPGAETRGEGGYVILPPSRHPSGRLYSWTRETAPVPAPAALLEIVQRETAPAVAPLTPPQKPAARPETGHGDTRYGIAALEAESSHVRNAGNGEQEAALNEAALKIGALVAGGELLIDTARSRLISAGLSMASYNSRDRWTPEAVVTKVERGLLDGARNPRSSAPLESSVSHRTIAFMQGGPFIDHDPETGEIFAPSEPLESVVSSIGDPIPIDLWARYNAPALPRGDLPSVIEQLAFRHGEIMGVDPAGLAMAALTVCAAAITDDISVQVKRHDPSWRESARLWTGMIGPPSTKKSPIMRVAMRPIQRTDGTLMRAFMSEKEAYDALPPKEQKAAPKPKMTRHVVSDATIESLQEVLRHSTGGIISEQDELSGWFGAMDKYAPGKGAQADRAFWLKAFNGGRYTLDRIARGSSQIPNLSINLLGGVQPEVIRKITSESVDDGLIQRLLPVILGPATNGKDMPAGSVVDDYDRLVERLLVMKPPIRSGMPNLAGEERPMPLRFSETARELREGLEVEHLELVRALESTSGKLAAHFGKYDGIFARLCVLWHCIENADQVVPPVEISGDTAGRVARFMDKFIRPSAIAFYAGMLGLSDGHDLILGLAAYIVAEKLEEVNARVVQRSTRSLRSFTSDEARQLCERLEGFGWLDPMEPASRSSTPRWRVVPAVHELFAEKGRQDAERRKSARDALRSVLEG